MLGMNYLKLLLANYKYYKRIKDSKMPVVNNKLPSSTYLKYLPQCNFNGKRVLNIGAGGTVFPAANVTNLDAVAGDGINVVWDCSKTPLPFESNTFDHVIANHCMEHIPNWFECMKDLARVVKTGGKIEIWIPPISSDSAFAYRDHINRIGPESFSGCLTNHRPGANASAAEEFKALGDFKKLAMVDRRTRPIITWWTMLAPDFVLSWMTTYLRNTVSEECYVFEKMP